jgi:hypothetical protein
MRLLDLPESDEWCLQVAPVGHFVAGASVLHLLAHRAGAFTKTGWYGTLAAAVVRKAASWGAHCCTM